MKRYSFATFKVNNANQDAFEVCRRIAERQQVTPKPVILLGEDGSGKTHLLYSIVNRVRGGSAKTGLAYVTAHDFPKQVRDLVRDPSPLERAQSAILLVDHLDVFSSHLEELEAVIRIFLDNGHDVVLATSIHPQRLRNLPDTLIALLNSGQVVRINTSSEPEEPSSREPEAVVAPLLDENRRLREKLAEIEAKAPDPNHVAAIEAELEATRADYEAAQVELVDLRDAYNALQAEAEEIRLDHRDCALKIEEVDALREELNALRSQFDNVRNTAIESADHVNALRASLDAAEQDRADLRAALEAVPDVDTERDTWELERGNLIAERNALAEERKVLASVRDALVLDGDALRERVKHLEAQLQSAIDRAVHVDALLAERGALEDELRAAREELEGARRDGASARGEANVLVERAEALLEQIEANRAHFAETEERYQDRIRDLEALLAEQDMMRASAAELERAEGELQATRVEAEAMREETESLRNHLAGLREEFDRTRMSFETELALAKAEAGRAAEIRDAFEAERDQALTDRAAAIQANESLTTQLNEMITELSSVRLQAQQRQDELEKLLELAEAETSAAREEAETVNAAATEHIGRIKADAEAAIQEAETIAEERIQQIEAACAERIEQMEEVQAAAQEAASALEAELRAQIATLETEREQMRAAAIEAESRHNVLQHEAEQLRADLDDQIRVITEFREQTSLKMAAAHQRIDTLESSLADTGRAREAALASGQAAHAEVRAIQQTLAGLLEALGQTGERLEKAFTVAASAEEAGYMDLGTAVPPLDEEYGEPPSVDLSFPPA